MKLDVKKRQISINSFLNDPESDEISSCIDKSHSKGISLTRPQGWFCLAVLLNPRFNSKPSVRAYRNGLTKFAHVLVRWHQNGRCYRFGLHLNKKAIYTINFLIVLIYVLISSSWIRFMKVSPFYSSKLSLAEKEKKGRKTHLHRVKWGKSEDEIWTKGKKVDNGRTKFSPRTCDDSESDPDVVFIGEEAAVTTGSGSGPTNHDDVFIEEEAAVTLGSGSRPADTVLFSLGRRMNQIPGSWSGNSTDESESEASSEEDNDDSKDKNYQVSESSNSSQFDDITSDFDDRESRK
ncbi:hypothetical protein HAX54_004107 [Datura stramonium]|uniref:Uncharacterized protein n=1 Tax=Datura stramonium TaxID=4076 RepID=A0ABS8WUP3_DATST|nr:hypothetical protein [Datura stramonium]